MWDKAIHIYICYIISIMILCDNRYNDMIEYSTIIHIDSMYILETYIHIHYIHIHIHYIHYIHISMHTHIYVHRYTNTCAHTCTGVFSVDRHFH